MNYVRVISLMSALAIGVLPNTALAGGTVGFEQVERLLHEQPTTYQWLASTLRFPDSAFAEVRFSNSFPTLGGARMGPYVFRAQTRDKSRSVEVEVVLCTTTKFVDAKGQELRGDRIFGATRVIEHLSSIQVRDESPSFPRPQCPE